MSKMVGRLGELEHRASAGQDEDREMRLAGSAARSRESPGRQVTDLNLDFYHKGNSCYCCC